MPENRCQSKKRVVNAANQVAVSAHFQRPQVQQSHPGDRPGPGQFRSGNFQNFFTNIILRISKIIKKELF
jgi:hypothetical protein